MVKALTRIACGLAGVVSTMVCAGRIEAATPRVLAQAYKLELVASEPEIVTPIGMAFDAKGRLFVVESHTHQRPDKYDGPQGDRIRLLSDSDGDGRLDRWSTFAEGFQQAMNVWPRPDGGLYLTTRRDVRVLKDVNGDGVMDSNRTIVRLKSDADYPHNGLGGVTTGVVAGVGERLFIAHGENFGEEFTLEGSDGRRFEQRGGVGAVYHCDPDGAHLERYADGFWNPFSLCVVGDRLFCVENDPDASPPCRLIDVKSRGDYGFRYEFGRAGVHPLQSWNGELPGTLPMICGVGEAPTAIVGNRNYLWVTSWGDHRIERYELRTLADSSALDARLAVVVQGDEDFRPTGMAVAPDGSLYFGDWVDRSYPVHGKGRIWRLTLPVNEEGPPWPVKTDPATTETGSTGPWAELQRLRWEGATGAVRENAIKAALRHSSPDVRMYAIRWAAEAGCDVVRDDIAKLLDGEVPNERYFLVVLAAIDWLDGDGSMRNAGISDSLLARELRNSNRRPELQALALRLMSPTHDWLTLERLRGWVSSQHPGLQLEAVRTLAECDLPKRFELLGKIAADGQLESEVRAEAIVGLAPAVDAWEALLVELADDDDESVSSEASRILRLTGKRRIHDEAMLSDKEAIRQLLIAPDGDAASGRRLFFTKAGPRCANCHRHQGRGGRIGPDLTSIGRQQSRERIVKAILRPSEEIAPHFQAWTLVTVDGLTRAGLRLPKAGDDGNELYADGAGETFELPSENIETREPSGISIMPSGLDQNLTLKDLRDLAAFLTSSE